VEEALMSRIPECCNIICRTKLFLPVNYCCENLLCVKIGFVLAFCYLQWIIWSDLFGDKNLEKALEKCLSLETNWSKFANIFGIFCKIFNISIFYYNKKIGNNLGFKLVRNLGYKLVLNLVRNWVIRKNNP
jgi:hypothetical protein